MTSSERSGSCEPITPAQELQTELLAFAASNTAEREANLAGLVDYIAAVTTRATLDEMLGKVMQSEQVDLRPNFRLAVLKTLQTRLIVDEEPTIPWVGNYTVVAIDSEGCLRAAEAWAEGKAYQKHGPDLFAPALTKAVIQQHLLLKGNFSGIEDRENDKYVAKLITRDRYLGAVCALDSKTVVAASGCELRPEYINGLVPEDMQDQYSSNFLTGRANLLFAKQVADYWFDQSLIHEVEEPEFFDQFRRSH